MGLEQVADGVLVKTSEWVATNSVVVEGPRGVLVVDPGIHESELAAIVEVVRGRGAVGFATHPHWDHLLWHAGLGDGPRWATTLATATAEQRLAGGVDRARAGIPDDVSLELLGRIAGLDVGEIPWDGPRVSILEHSAHAPGHAALLIEERRVLVAGDMLSDVLIPMLDAGAADPVADYLNALDLLEGASAGYDVVVPGHGSVAHGAEVARRLAQDRAYVTALRDGTAITDPRIDSPEPGWEWVAGVHEGQLARLTG